MGMKAALVLLRGRISSSIMGVLTCILQDPSRNQIPNQKAPFCCKSSPSTPDLLSPSI